MTTAARVGLVAATVAAATVVLVMSGGRTDPFDRAVRLATDGGAVPPAVTTTTATTEVGADMPTSSSVPDVASASPPDSVEVVTSTTIDPSAYQVIFEEVEDPPDTIKDGFPPDMVFRTRYVKADAAALASYIEGTELQVVHMALFDDTPITVRTTRPPLRSGDSLGLSGPVFVGGKEVGMATMSVYAGQAIYGSLIVDNRFYAIADVGEGLMGIWEVDVAALPPDSPNPPSAPPPPDIPPPIIWTPNLEGMAPLTTPTTVPA